MLEFVGAHYDVLAEAAGLVFMLILGAVAIDDALRRRHARGRSAPAAAPAVRERVH